MQLKVKGNTVKKYEEFPAFQKFVWRAGVAFTQNVGLAFVRGAAEHVKIDTGMSMASLIPFTEALEAKQSPTTTELITRAYTGKAKKWYDPFMLRGQSFSRRTRKTAKLGYRLGKDAYTVRFGTPVKPFFFISYEIVITQFHIHNPIWRALKAGRRAARAYEQAILRSHLRPYLKKGFAYYMKTGRIYPPISLPQP